MKKRKLIISVALLCLVAAGIYIFKHLITEEDGMIDPSTPAVLYECSGKSLTLYNNMGSDGQKKSICFGKIEKRYFREG